MKRKIAVAPCSGIGKSLGAAAREAAFILAEDLRPDKTKMVALSLLVMGDGPAKLEVAGGEAVAIDGCKLECAAKVLACSGAAKVHKIAVFDVLRRHRGLKPEGVCDLNEDGSKLARAAAEEAAGIVDGIDGEDGHA
ncbi:MAG TPA: putative zinc-binding protein [Candidatus Aminicenantes bacterium]|nr:putative zinc-binding protein [Candidatus Aminicenantes bacterium]HRY63923.1 putative zinc-binding protein [Candidatus Aminicenantes bacterium]HRZ70836.1 putative zinc-binding protein [Candidatus Aminicenantes bacterium]